MVPFPWGKLDRTLSPEAREAICDLILAWADFDMVTSHWVLQAFGMPLDSGSILLGNMDTKTKLDRLKQLYGHYGQAVSVASITRLLKAQLEFVEVRNMVAHRKCVGMIKPDYQQLAFTSVKRVHGEPGNFEVTLVWIEQLTEGAKFARNAAEKIWKITDAITRPIGSPPPPKT